MRARTPCQNTAAPKTQTTSPTTPHFQRFSPKWSAIWAPHRLKSRPRRHQSGELHYTSLRHAARRLRVVQNPHDRRRGGHWRSRRARAAARRGPGCGTRGRRQGLAGQRADAPSKARGADDSRAGRRPRAHKAARPGTTARGPLHPLRAAAPVTGRCTRSEGVHCLRIGCITPNHKNKRGICETTTDDLTGFVDDRTKGHNCHKAHNVWTRADTTQPREHASSRGHPGASTDNGRLGR